MSLDPCLIDIAQTDFEGEPCTVLAAPFAVPAARDAGGEEKFERFPEQFGAGVTEHLFRGAIDQHDGSIRVGRHNGLLGGLEQHLGVTVRLLQFAV